MAFEAHQAAWFDQIRVVLRSVNVVAGTAHHAPAIHNALDQVVPLHTISVRRAVGEVREGGLAEFGLFELQKSSRCFRMSKPTGQSYAFPGEGGVSGRPWEWHWMQVLVASTVSSLAGFTMFVGEGC